MSELARAAFRYTEHGWLVLPCHSIRDGRCTCGKGDCTSPGKHPILRHGLKEASRDREQVREWWAQRPLANVGVRTGECSGIVVLDIDGGQGEEEAFRICHERGWFFDTTRQRTGRRRGWHLIFRHPGGRVPNRKLGPGLETRGDGGYIVAAPSAHASGRRYWMLWPPEDLAPQPLPEWVVERLAGREDAPPQSPAPAPPAPLTSHESRGQHRGYATSALRSEAEAVRSATVGDRNNRLNAAAFKVGTLVGAGLLDPEGSASVLLGAALAAGLEEREARRTILSGLRSGTQHPRSVGT